jgi:hypothetical protein
MYARKSSLNGQVVAQAVDITAALPTMARASERRESPIRARSHRVDTLCSPVLKVGGTKETASNNYKVPLGDAVGLPDTM